VAAAAEQLFGGLLDPECHFNVFFSSKFRNNSYRILIVAKLFGIGLIVFAA